jgi:hypothetical protein
LLLLPDWQLVAEWTRAEASLGMQDQLGNAQWALILQIVVFWCSRAGRAKLVCSATTMVMTRRLNLVHQGLLVPP